MARGRSERAVRGLAGGVVTAALLCLGAALAAAPPVGTRDDVAAYLRDASGGLIDAAPDPEGRYAALRYVRSPNPPDRFVPAAPRPPAPDQDAYVFDVDDFVAAAGAQDFVDAKRRTYAALPWSERDQVHVQPYARPTAWQTLNHPPIKQLEGPLSRWTSLFSGPAPETDPALESAFFDPAFQVALDQQTGTALTHGNTVRLLASGAAFPEKLRLVREARERLYVAVMFWACDASSDALADALIARSQQGVDVRVITEGLYRETITRRCIDRLVAGGVPVLSARDTLRPGSVGSVMHWKVWIRDGEELIIGGQNVLDYQNRSTGFNLRNRDTDALVRGPAVTDAERAWAAGWDDWSRTDDLAGVIAEADARAEAERAAGLRGQDRYAAWLSDPEARMSGNCRVILQGAADIRQPVGRVIEAHLAESRTQVVLSTPTVRYDHHARGAEAEAGMCVHRLMARIHDGDGPTVTLITNGAGGAIGESSTWLRGRRDRAAVARQWFLYRLARQYGELLGRRTSIANRAVTVPLRENPRVEVWTYFQYIHSKLYLFDRLAGLVGSWNLEVNSSELNPEAAIICLDTDLRDQLQADLALALVNAVPEDSASDPPVTR